MALNVLPNELLEQVLGYLPWHCLPEKALVCKKWFSIIQKWLKRHHDSDLLLIRTPQSFHLRCSLQLDKPILLDLCFDHRSHLRKLQVTNITHQDLVTLLTKSRHQLAHLEDLNVEIYDGDTSVGMGPAYISLPNLRALRFAAYRKQRDFLWRLAWMYVIKAPKLKERHIIEAGYRKLIFLFVDEPVRDRGLLAGLASNCKVLLNYLLIVFLYLVWQ